MAKIETRSESAVEAGWEEVRASVMQRIVRWVLSLLGREVDSAATVQSARLLFLHTDQVGAPRIATDAKQRVVWRSTYDAFGAATAEGDPDSDGARVTIELRFVGQLHDRETGTDYNYHRDYDPRLGRYLQSDPIGLAGGLNTYAYAESAPHHGIDPYGLKNYRIGSEELKLVHDAGAGAWNSEPATIYAKLKKFDILKNLYFVPLLNARIHLRHYFQNTGEDLKISATNMIDASLLAQADYRTELEEAIKFVTQLDLPNGSCTQITSGAWSSRQLPPDQTLDWFLAVGDYKAWGTGTITVGQDDMITLHFKYHVADRYNWDKGKSIQLGGLTLFEDDDLGAYHRQGLAREFNLAGSVTRTITWRRGETPTNLDWQP